MGEEMTKTVDQWAAEQCGIVLCEDEIRYESPNTAGWEYGEWTIKDPRCREIVREHFRIDTNEGFGDYRWSATGYSQVSNGETIAEAEIACITAIYEASQ